jgi:hypothetical protein
VKLHVFPNQQQKIGQQICPQKIFFYDFSSGSTWDLDPELHT